MDFNVTYRNDEGDLRERHGEPLFVNVRKGLSPTSDKDTASLGAEAYNRKLQAQLGQGVPAGETFDLEFTIKNTSDSTNLRNVQIHIKDAGETATIVPASGGSNTLYISKIGKGQKSSSQKVSLQTAPDATAKAYTLNVDFSYESASASAAHAANEYHRPCPRLQKIRLKCDEPTVYDDVSYLDSSTSMSIKMYNMGRSSIYNCIVDVEGNGLKLEESYLRAAPSAPAPPLRQIYPCAHPSEAGDIQGTVVISFTRMYTASHGAGAASLYAPRGGPQCRYGKHGRHGGHGRRRHGGRHDRPRHGGRLQGLPLVGLGYRRGRVGAAGGASSASRSSKSAGRADLEDDV